MYIAEECPLWDSVTFESTYPFVSGRVEGEY